MLSQIAQTNFVCDYPAPMADTFDPERYMGVWYSIASSAGDPHIPVYPCISALYDQLDLTVGSFRVQNASCDVVGEVRDNLTGTASIADCPNAQAKVSFFGAVIDEPNYKILDTDYDTYAVVYACDDDSAVPNLWFLGRENSFSDELLATLKLQTAETLPNYDWTMQAFNEQTDECKYDTGFNYSSVPTVL